MSVVCPSCKSAQRLSFWELHARLGQCWELEIKEHAFAAERMLRFGPSLKFPGEESHEVGPIHVDDESSSVSPGKSRSESRRSLTAMTPCLTPSQRHVVPPEEAAHELDLAAVPSPGALSGMSTSQRRNSMRGFAVVPGQPTHDSHEDIHGGKRPVLDRQQSRNSSDFRCQLAVGRRRSAKVSEANHAHPERIASLKVAESMGEDMAPHECWQQRSSKSTRPMPSPRGAMTRGSTQGATQGISEKGLNKDAPAGLARFVATPGRPLRNAWDILAVVFLVHDMIVIPLRFFDMPAALFLEILAWFTQVFWNLDIIASFMTGYYEDGNLILRPVKIAKNYCQSWLMFDLTVVSLDWLILFLATDSDAQGVHRLSKTVRLLRFLRMVRILRLAKISRMSEAVQEQIQSQSANIQYSLFKSIFRLLLLTHLIACSWYGIGRLSDESDGQERSWIMESSLVERTLSYQYTTSYHWALCQLGVGGIAIYPTNTYERSFGIFSAFTALMTFSTLVSKMTSLMSSLNKLKDEEMEQFRLLRRYLIYNDIPLHLSQRIVRFLQHGYRMRHEALSAGSHLPILDLLSESLQGELQFERYRGCLYELKFTERLLALENRQTVQVLHKLSMNALANTVVAHDDVLFCSGDLATAAYFVQSGHMNYHDDFGDEPSPVEGHNWIAEMTLWTPWVHLGDLVAEDVSRLVVLQVDAFCKVVGDSNECRSVAVVYAKEYVEHLKLVQDLSDIMQNPKTSKTMSKQNSMRPAASWWSCLFGKDHVKQLT